MKAKQAAAVLDIPVCASKMCFWGFLMQFSFTLPILPSISSLKILLLRKAKKEAHRVRCSSERYNERGGGKISANFFAKLGLW